MLWVETTSARFSIERAHKRARQVSPQPAFVEAGEDNADLSAAERRRAGQGPGSRRYAFLTERILANMFGLTA
jgi:hypothetical protein